jgi:hypothetical protein
VPCAWQVRLKGANKVVVDGVSEKRPDHLTRTG